MRIVIFTGGNHAEQKLITTFLNRYIPDYVIAADSGLEQTALLNIAPDCILGDFDSLQNHALLKKYPKADIRVFPRDKDFTDTELAMQQAEKVSTGKNDEIVIIGAGGAERIDHLIYFLRVFESTIPPAVWLFDTGCGFYLSHSLKNELTLSLPIGTIVSVFAISRRHRIFPAKIHSNGLHWELDNLHWNRAASISNRTDIKEVSFKVKHGRFLILVGGHAWLQ